MFFSGDSSTRKRVDLGGRSSKERDRQMLLEQARLERKRRMSVRQQNAAALKIQKCFRGRKAVALERSNVREQFFNNFGDCCQNVDRYCFSPHSDFLRQLLFFFKANNIGDFIILVETCQKLLHIIGDNGDLLDIIAGKNYSKYHALVDNRLKCLSYACLEALHQNRDRLKDQFLAEMKFYNVPAVILLDTMVALLNPVLPWACKVGGYLSQRKAFALLREILLVGMHGRKTSGSPQKLTSMEHVLILIASHSSQDPFDFNMDPRCCFYSQILSIPLLWHYFPHLKEAFATRELIKQNIRQMSICLNKHLNVFSEDFSQEFPGHACLLGNILEASTIALAQPFCNRTMAADFAIVMSYLLQALPPTKASTLENLDFGNEMVVDDEDAKSLNPKLERQISNATDPRLLELLVNSLFRLNLHSCSTFEELSSGEEVTAIGAICLFLHVTFSVLPVERIMTVLAYRTDIVFILWNFLKSCHDDQQWPSFSRLAVHMPEDAPGWILPLAVFCPMYKHMLMIIDNEEFYEQEKPLSLKDIRYLIIILRQALWELLWSAPGNISGSQKSSHCNRLSADTLKQRVKLVSSELLSQLQDWNNRRPFTSPSDFHAPEAVGDSFVSQALNINTRTEDVLRHAPFLVPFTSRVKIFTSQLASVRKRDDHHPGFTRFRFKIRRNQIFEDAFNQLRTLSEDELRGMIRVSFINEVGAEEAGIDGGGMFKDFMENAIRAGFDVQYGLFKETTDHLLYPNPGSEMIHEQHLHFFHFLGTLLGKAMFEGILVDIPFAMFFLSKLKQKYNYLNDLPSLDPELYRHLLFLKHYEGDVSELELYFVVVNNDYGEQREEELISGGRNIRVTKDNVITFIHLIANYRLNFQIRHQSLHFLRGFQKIIQKEWIDMFNEHEIQLLISGSLDGMDVNDLRSNAHYSGGYHQNHAVIEMFWDVIKSFSSEHQHKFLKFVTGCSRGPLLGFKYLEPKFCIQRAAPLEITGDNLDRLPTSATCMNLLKLPPYTSKEQLRAKLLYAISAEAGFDLS